MHGEYICIQGFGGKARRKETIGIPRRRWKDNITMDLREIVYCGMGSSG
jgi:hypothetical protein